MSKRTPRLLLEDIKDPMAKITLYTHNSSYEDFVNDTRTLDAVVRNFEIIGEAANLLPREFTERYPAIEWHRIVGLRNRLVHGYFGVDPSIVWRVVQHELSPLGIAINQILNEL